jgi:hypothetical protein
MVDVNDWVSGMVNMNKLMDLSYESGMVDINDWALVMNQEWLT